MGSVAEGGRAKLLVDRDGDRDARRFLLAALESKSSIEVDRCCCCIPSMQVESSLVVMDRIESSPALSRTVSSPQSARLKGSGPIMPQPRRVSFGVWLLLWLLFL